MAKVKILKPVLLQTEVVADEISFFNSDAETMADTRCNGHEGNLGYANPKASVRVGNQRYLLCSSCWKSQNIEISRNLFAIAKVE